MLRYQGDATRLNDFWPYLTGSFVARAVQDSGFDVKGELLDRLEPGSVAGVSLSPTVQLGAGLPSLDPRRTNPFRYVQLVAVGDGKDAAGLASLLEKLPPVAKRFGADIQPTDVNGQRVYLTTYARGEGAHRPRWGTSWWSRRRGPGWSRCCPGSRRLRARLRWRRSCAGRSRRRRWARCWTCGSSPRR
ncbi:hypothetical protein ACN28S_43805 [Cystobacter fuscus]